MCVNDWPRVQTDGDADSIMGLPVLLLVNNHTTLLATAMDRGISTGAERQKPECFEEL